MEITPELRAHAKINPGGHVYVIEGVDDAMGAVPPEKIRGAWKVDESGEIVGDFLPNPNFSG